MLPVASLFVGMTPDVVMGSLAILCPEVVALEVDAAWPPH